ncbi:MAG: helix-turn-helix domain-containing protein [Oscillospiraceae bacterium]|nr:helix-turn-helix domain-containing protein [Oscillospiraceae bacterium]
MDEKITELLSIEDLMELLNVGKNTAYSLLETGKIKAFKIGRIWKVPRKAVEDYIYSEVYGKNNS